MRKSPTPMRAPAGQFQRGSERGIRPAIRNVGGSSLILLTILFWLILYQNLPDNPLNPMSPAGQVSAVTVVAAADADTGNTTFRIIRIGMLAIGAFVVVTRWSLVRALAKTTNPGLVAFMLLAPASAVWSIDRQATLLRFTTFACIVLVCFAISLTGWDRQRLQRVAIPPLMCILVASLVLGVIYPDRIIEIGSDISQLNAWHGIAFSKNVFGMTASAGFILCLHRWLAREGRLSWSIAGTAAAFACLILSRSNTSLFAALVGTFFMVLAMRVPAIKLRYSTHVVLGITATLLLYEMAILDLIPGVNVLLAPITGLTGKDTTFSARTIIWNIIKEHIRGAPYLGSGYGAYWTGPNPNSPSYIFQYLMYFYPTESHNGYLDIVNDLGRVGLVCLLVFIVWYIKYALQLMRTDPTQATLYLAMLFQEMVLNMSESDWFSRSSSFVMIILGSFCLSRALLENRLHPQPQRSARK